MPPSISDCEMPPTLQFIIQQDIGEMLTLATEVSGRLSVVGVRLTEVYCVFLIIRLATC